MIDIINSVKHYQPVFWDVDNSRLLESNRSNILYANEQNEKAQQASTDLMAAINQLDINEDYRYVKDELFNELDGIINSTLQNYGGNLRYAINDIQSMSRDILSSPKITGLVETNQQYKKWKAEIEGRNDISDDIKAMYIDKNPYVFTEQYKTDDKGNDIVDKNGNKEIIGYDDWKPNSNPVQQIDYNTYNKIALDFINNEKKTFQIVEYLDENRNVIPKEELEKNGYKGAVYYRINGGTEEEVTDKRIVDALSAAFKSNPNIEASLQQDYDVALWKTKKGKDVYGFKNSDGSFKSPEEYKLEIFQNIVDAYGYKNTGYIQEQLDLLIKGNISDDNSNNRTPYLKQHGDIVVNSSTANDAEKQQTNMNKARKKYSKYAK